MNLAKRLTVVLACSALLTGLPALAGKESATPDPYLELLRGDVRLARVELLTEAIVMTEGQAELFWPIFEEYDKKLTKIGDRRVALVEKFLETYETASAEDLSDLMKKWFEIQNDRLDLRKHYFHEVSRAVGAPIAAQFVQVEYVVGMMIDLQIAAEMPLVQR